MALCRDSEQEQVRTCQGEQELIALSYKTIEELRKQLADSQSQLGALEETERELRRAGAEAGSFDRLLKERMVRRAQRVCTHMA